MKKKIFLTAIVLVMIGYFLVDTWITLFTEKYIVKWQHLTALLLFLPLPLLLLKHYKAAVLGTGIYLVLGLFRLLSLTAGISTAYISVVGFEISGFNWLCLGLLLLFFMFHLDVLIDMQRNYKKTKVKMRNP